jgi:hypothetical protein
MHPYFICDQDAIESKLRTLTKSKTSDNGWIEYFVDQESNEEWLLTHYHSEYQGGGSPVLKRLPEPTIDELVEIAMTSSEKSDIIGASLELSERERNKKVDFRDKLINRLLKISTFKLTDFEKERLKIIIYESNLYDATNRRNIVGKHFTEIENDANYYRTISQKAKGILWAIKAECS